VNVKVDPYTSTPAGFWRRFAGAFIDLIIINLIAAFFGFGLGMIAGLTGNRSIESLTLAGYAIGIIVAWLYNALLESSSVQASWGKLALGLKVIDLDGNRISFGRASARHFGKILSAMILMIGFLMMLGSERRQTLHDLMAGCLMIKRVKP